MYSYLSSSDVFVAIGNKDIRQKWLEQLRDKHAELPILVHSKAVIGTNVLIGCGLGSHGRKYSQEQHPNMLRMHFLEQARQLLKILKRPVHT